MHKPSLSWRKYGAFLFLLIAVVIYSCRKDNSSSLTTQADIALSDAQLIAKAKIYFDSSMVGNSSSNKQAANYLSPIEGREKNINWEEAYTYVAHTGKMVMLPVRFKKQLYAQVGQQKLLLDNLTRLFVYTGKSGKKHIEVVTRIPDEAYLNNPAKNKPFSGIVKVNDWQGKFIKAYRFTGGKIISLGAPDYMPINKNNKVESAYRKNDIFCYSIPFGEYNYSGDYTYWVTSGYETHCYGSGGSGGYDQDQEFDEHDYGQGGETGDGDTPPPPPRVTIVVDSLKSKYPCAVKLILDKLLYMQSYGDFVEPFCGTQKPDLYWDAKRLPWNQSNVNGTQTFQLGEEIASPTSRLGLSRDIYLNASALDNSSQLLISAAVIHETLHAYIGYNISIADNNVQNHYNDYGTWFGALDAFYSIRNLPPNYSGHYQMLTDYFNKATGILSSWDNNSHTPKEYAMAMLYGLNTTDPNCPADVKARLNNIFTSVMTTYSITLSDLNTFNINNLNATSSNKLPTTGCN